MLAWCALLPGPPPCQVLMDGRSAAEELGVKSWAGDVGKLFECRARREAGARGREIVKLCGRRARRRAALALPGAAREGGPRVPRRAPASRQTLPRACSWVRAYPAERCAGTGVWPPPVAGKRAGERASRRAVGREGGRGSEAGGRGLRGALAELAARYSNPSTSGKPIFSAPGRFCILSSHRWCWWPPSVGESPQEERQGGAETGRRLGGVGSKRWTRSPISSCLSVSACRSGRAVISAPGYSIDTVAAKGLHLSSHYSLPQAGGWNSSCWGFFVLFCVFDFFFF